MTRITRQQNMGHFYLCHHCMYMHKGAVGETISLCPKCKEKIENIGDYELPKEDSKTCKCDDNCECHTRGAE